MTNPLDFVAPLKFCWSVKGLNVTKKARSIAVCLPGALAWFERRRWSGLCHPLLLLHYQFLISALPTLPSTQQVIHIHLIHFTCTRSKHKLRKSPEEITHGDLLSELRKAPTGIFINWLSIKYVHVEEGGVT
jgi:hypothetical protein